MIARATEATQIPNDTQDPELAVLLQALAEGMERADTDRVLDCFAPHAVLHAPDEALPLEGTGSLRSYFRRRIRSHRIEAVPQPTAISTTGTDRAIVRAESEGSRGDRFVFALQRSGGRWLITHCHWTMTRVQRR